MDEESKEDDDYFLDEVRGTKRKPKMSILNQNKVSKDELDDLFNDWC